MIRLALLGSAAALALVAPAAAQDFTITNATVATGDGSEPVGKKLGFLVQEMLREANTVGSKANDATLSQASVAIKEEIERIREQVENVE